MNIDFTEKLRCDEKESFHKVFINTYSSLLLFAQRYTGNLEHAEDIVQESFLTLWNKRTEIKDMNKIKSLLYITVRNKCLNALRDQKIRKFHYNKFFSNEIYKKAYFESTLIEEEVWSLILKALEKAGDQTKKVCLMSIDGMNNSDIAQKLNLSIRTVKYHKTKGKSTLAFLLKSFFSSLFVIFQ